MNTNPFAVCQKLAVRLMLALCATWSAQAFSQSEILADVLPIECGGPRVENHYGPYDYTNPLHYREKLPIVEGAHFTPKVEMLLSGETGYAPGGDLDYTLRAFPNHHRALYAMGLYQLQHAGAARPPEASYSADCYFRRAITFSPRDGTARMVYGIYLARSGRLNDAEEQYKISLALTPESAELHNNVSLLYIEKKDYPQARHHARKAMELGFPLAGAKNKLRRLGEWNDDTDGHAN